MDWSYIDTGCLVELSWTNKDAKVNRDRVTSNHDQLWTFTWTCLEFTQPCKEVLMDYLCESLALIFADQRETEKARIHLKSHGHCPGSSPNLCYQATRLQASCHPKWNYGEWNLRVYFLTVGTIRVDYRGNPMTKASQSGLGGSLIFSLVCYGWYEKPPCMWWVSIRCIRCW